MNKKAVSLPVNGKAFSFFVAVILALGVAAREVRALQPAPVSEDRWPCAVSADNRTFKVYQPQLDSWDGFVLRAHAAVGLEKGNAAVTYGVASFTANTIVDKETRFVRFENLRIDGVHFPSEPDKEPAYLSALRSAAPLQLEGMSLDRLEANLAILKEQEKGEAQQLDNTPPRIIFSPAAALLVSVYGEPVFSPVQNTSLSRIINTQVLLVKDRSGKYFLHVFDGYMEARALQGPWTVAATPPADAAAAEQQAQAARLDLLEGEADPATNRTPSLRQGRPPLVYIATTPTELIVTDGEPQYAPIEGTNLLAVTNTTANVFKDLDDQQTYVLLSGRWFRGPSNNGPWENVAGGSLPRDFALIPDASAKENAKASVPGTPQAAEAVIANTIPTTAKVDRAASVQLPVQIDGEPQLKPVEGTPLRYIFNASIPVIRVDAKSWYAVYSGVWYVATSAGGPWVVADMVPAVIYSIPVTSSLHYVTYVRIYNATPRYVYVGYTPGYYGTVIAPDGTVVYGTGYRYPAYVSRRHWFAPIVTYGYGCGMRWTPWYGWSFGFGFGWGYPDAWAYPPAPYWGPFFIERHYFRRQFRTWGISTALNAYYRSLPPPAHSRQYGQAYNSRTGNRIVGIASAINNVAHQTPAAVSPGARRQMLNKAAPPARERRGIVSPGSVFGTREGRVYSYESRGNRWQHLNPPPAARRPPAVSVPEALSREKAARDQGDSRANNYQQYGTPPHQEERQGPPGIVSPGQGILRQQQGGGKKSRSEKRHSKHSDGNGR